nr:MAG TPA: hypothetical protein [Bacteriophage sp.]DAW22219.1 MAG TPA: hypothetical protein [Bacteriophage sp.]
MQTPEFYSSVILITVFMTFERILVISSHSFKLLKTLKAISIWLCK